LFIKTSELLAYKKAIAYQNGKEMKTKAVQDSIITPANNLIDSNRPEGCTTLGNLILEIIKPKVDEANQKAEEEAKKKADEEKRRKEEERKKAGNNTQKKGNTSVLNELDNELPNTIFEKVKKAERINKKDYKQLTAKQKAVIDSYHDWLGRVYFGKKDENQRNEIKNDYLSKKNTFNGLLNIIKRFQGQ